MAIERPQSRPDVDPDGLDPHPLAALIPEMSTEEFSALRDDIAKRGLLEPIVLHEGKILDGRHRYRACLEAARVPDFTEYVGIDPVGYVVALNVHRRHLTASQKAVLALAVEAEYAKAAKENMAEGGRVSQDRETLSAEPIHAAKKAAEVVGVSAGYVSDAKRIAAVDPGLLASVANGETTIPKALATITKPVPRPDPRPDPAMPPGMRRSPREDPSEVRRRATTQICNLVSLAKDLDWTSVAPSYRPVLLAEFQAARTELSRIIKLIKGAE